MRRTAPRPLASPALLWPPNNKFVPVAIGGTTDAEGDALTLAITSIRQSRAGRQGQLGCRRQGHRRAGDYWSIRGQKLGGGDGRVDHVSFTASDGHGGACTGVVRVTVPHDQAKSPVDGGPLYDSTVPTP